MSLYSVPTSIALSVFCTTEVHVLHGLPDCMVSVKKKCCHCKKKTGFKSVCELKKRHPKCEMSDDD